jgi:hypothetical protein
MTDDTPTSTSPILTADEWRALAADCEQPDMRRVAELAAEIATLMEQPIGITTLGEQPEHGR